MVLNLQDPFGLPLGAQAAALLGLAARAVTLFAIDAIERMAEFAVRLLRIDIAERARVAQRVLGRRNRVEMLRIDAVAMTTSVIDDEAFGNGSVRQPHRHAMGFASGTAKHEDTIAVPILQPSPQDAIACGRAFGAESFEFLRSRVVWHSRLMVNVAGMVILPAFA